MGPGSLNFILERPCEMIHKLPQEIFTFHVVPYLPVVSILRLRRVCKQFSTICCEEIEFWKLRSCQNQIPVGHSLALEKKDFGFVKFTEPQLTDFSLSIAAAAKIGKLKLVRKYLNSEFSTRLELEELKNAMYYSARFGHLKILKYLFSVKTPLPETLEGAMYNAGRGGFQPIIDFLIKQGASLNKALKGCAYVGNIKLFKRLLSQGAQPDHLVLRAAARGGSWDMVRLLLSLGINDANSGALGAVEGNHRDIEIFFRKQGPCDNEMIEKVRHMRQVVSNAAWKIWRKDIQCLW